MPLVSVIMPSYNHEKYISEAIESILNQTFADFELIIIDDGSKDGSKEIIKSCQQKDSRIRTIFHNENKGIARTVNDGLEDAKAKFIAYFASDDVWVKDNLKKQLEVLEKNEDLVVWSESLVIDAQGNPTGETFTQKLGASKRKKSGDIFEELLRGNYICASSIVLKRENLRDIRYDEQLKYLNDYKLMVDLARRYEFCFIPEPLAMYRIHGQNSILLDRIGWGRDRTIIGQYFLQQYGDDISNTVRNKILLMISEGYSTIGEGAKAKAYAYRAVRLNPLNRANLLNLVTASTRQNGVIHNILRCGYRGYKRLAR